MLSVLESFFGLFFCLFFGIFIKSCYCCVSPSGIGSGPDDLVTIATLSTIPNDIRGYYEFFNVINGFPIVEPDVETPIAFRSALYGVIFFYNALVAYEENALELWVRDDVSEDRRFCQPSPGNWTEETIFDLHRRASIAVGLYYYFIRANLGDDAINSWAGLLASWGLNATLCLVDANNCDDLSTPWGFVFALSNEIDEFSSRDGWNDDGSYNREYNKIAFSDFRDDDTRYIPVNSPWNLSKLDRWQPLLESDNLGFLSYQEHVTPHIGFTGKSFLYTNDEICSFETYDPNYDYSIEIELTLNRLANLNDTLKEEIELFDDKGILFSLMRQVFYEKYNLDVTSFEYVQRQLVVSLAFYESLLIVWKEKVRYDKVRPPSIIHELLGDELITSYAGEEFGTQTFFASDWEPYIRTMPHSEYPSGSSCFCQAFASAISEFEGFDDITDILPNGMVLKSEGIFSQYYLDLFYGPLFREGDITYNSFSQASKACGYSRLAGGMHFTQSVPSGETLCNHVGKRVSDSVKALVNGEKPQFMVDFYDTSVVERDCYFSSSSSSSSSDSSNEKKKSSSCD